jgi:hypothetical protein
MATADNSRLEPPRQAADEPEGIGVDFEIIGEIRAIETIASGRGIRILSRLNRVVPADRVTESA